MPTIGDKLTAIYDIKNKIREAIVNKGGSLHEKSALSDYPQAIYDLPVVSAPADTYNYHPNPAWWDIKTIIENDEVPEGYVAVAAFLLVDSVYQTSLDVFDAYKTSDGAFYSTQIEHIWDTSKDKESGEGYKTRYVIAYVKKDSDKWKGNLLCGRSFESMCPIACLGIVVNCNIFVHGYYQDYTYLNFGSTRINAWNTDNNYYYPFCFDKSWASLQYIDVTSRGKLVVIYANAFCSSYGCATPKNLRYLAPLYVIDTIFKEEILNKLKNNENKIIYKYKSNCISALTAFNDADTTDGSGLVLPLHLKNLEIHIPSTLLYYGSKTCNPSRLALNIGGLRIEDSTSDISSPNIPITMKIVVEKESIPEDYIRIPEFTSSTENYKVIQNLPSFITFYPNGIYAGNDRYCSLGIINFIIENKSAYNISVRIAHVYQLNGMPASKLNKFIFDYLEDRTGLVARKMYITSSQNEKLSSTTKQTIARRNWTLTVTA